MNKKICLMLSLVMIFSSINLRNIFAEENNNFDKELELEENKVENVADMNNLKTITLPVLEGILNEK